MPKFFSDTVTFNYNWDQVAQAFWKRYPNPNSKHVLTEDVVQREIKSGRLITKRILSKTNSIPKWAEKFVTTKHVNIVEESIVDPKHKVLVTYTRNLGYAKVMSVTEKVVYMESEENPSKTIAVRSAWIDSQVRGFSRAICAFGYERFKKNCMKMVGGFNHVLTSLYPHQHILPSTHSTITAAAKLKDAAKNASRTSKVQGGANICIASPKPVIASVFSERNLRNVHCSSTNDDVTLEARQSGCFSVLLSFALLSLIRFVGFVFIINWVVNHQAPVI
ncbi:hypothetical protein NQ317_004973 [Molorchus minor]|uniref:PRELI/MSF1 domain-containing protein n=1 Tax=Molorchus minor TaxID=1323400 RepID=A0ABQ9K593_9CUCU|nr:hypothetical protein NQ317_004973 [Molorchus minor]